MLQAKTNQQVIFYLLFTQIWSISAFKRTTSDYKSVFKLQMV